MAATQLAQISVNFPIIASAPFSSCTVRVMSRAGNDPIHCYTAAGLYMGKNLTTDSSGYFSAYVPALQDVRVELYSTISNSVVAAVDTTGGNASASSILIVSSSAPSNNDGRPDGTVYIQAS